jgi:protein-L-isoaspartate(D-aspartate) O-methyltransferase
MATLEGRMSGIGMTSVRTRTRMIERLREQGIRDEVVLEAMGAVPRHIFVDEALASRAYDDSPLPIGHGQTISQPWVVARMTELARNGGTLERVLEIGTGCGYQTAVLARIAAEVYSVERVGALVARARRNLQSLKVRNVRLKHGDGSTDLGEDLEVDAIVVTAAATHVPSALLKCLKPGGRLVVPLVQRDAPGEGVQRLTVLHATPGGYREQVLDAVRFVPLLTGLA